MALVAFFLMGVAIGCFISDYKNETCVLWNCSSENDGIYGLIELMRSDSSKRLGLSVITENRIYRYQTLGEKNTMYTAWADPEGHILRSNFEMEVIKK